MRSKFILSLCSVVCAGVLVIGGLTMAWFLSGDDLKGGETLAKTGTVKFTLSDPSPDGFKCYVNETVGFSWTMENEGSMDVVFRAWLQPAPPEGVLREAENSGWTSDGDGWLHPEPVRPGESVILKLTGSSEQPIEDYTAWLHVKAVQASNDADKDHEW